MNPLRSFLVTLAFLTSLVIACGEKTAGPPTVDSTPTSTPFQEPSPVKAGAAPTPPPIPLVILDGDQFIDASQLLDDFSRGGVFNGDDGLAGAAWLDYDSDGFLDLYIVNTRTLDNALFRNNGDSTFTDVAQEAGVANGEGNSGVATGDINNDGCVDLFLTGSGGWLVGTDSPAILYLNNCDGTFSDITQSAGILNPDSAFSSAFGDVNNDGLLDLFIGGTRNTSLDYHDKNKLYLNNGDLTFKDISALSGVATAFGTCGVAFTDYDSDGNTDLLLANCAGDNDVLFELFRNNGDSTFDEMATEVGLNSQPEGAPSPDPHVRIGVALGDYDNDGDIDLMSSSWGFVPGRRYVPRVHSHSLFENTGDGRYVDISEEAGLSNIELVGRGWGASFADFDNDGNADLFFLGAQRPARDEGLEQSNGYMIRNNGDRTFSLSHSYTLQSPLASGVAIGDFDNNGFPDLLIVTTEGPTTDGRPVLLQNAGNDNSWITIIAVGTTSNRDGIGARVSVASGDTAQTKEVQSGGSFLSANSPWLTFGLSDHSGPVDVEVKWPSGLSEIFENQPIRQIVTLTEGTGTPK